MERLPNEVVDTLNFVGRKHPKAGLIVTSILGIPGAGYVWLWPKSLSHFGFLVGWILLLLAAITLLASFKGLIELALRKERLSKTRGLQDIHDLTWKEFEELIADAYRGKGYKVQEVGGPGDGGIDLILRKDREVVAVQCKQWRNWKVGVGQVRDFKGGMADMPDSDRGIFVTCGKYSPDARSYAQRHRIELVDGDALLALIGEVNGRVSAVASERVAGAGGQASGVRPHSTSGTSPYSAGEDSLPTCPDCGNAMVRRTAKRGPHVGEDFWGCSSWPKCQGTRSIS
jgi:restriction system protein